MTPEEYERFSQALEARLADDPRVIGLVALGSYARPDLRDQWSDHDFWAITAAGAYGQLLADLAWLPEAGRIVIALRAGEHYYTLLYDNGHQVEFGAFDLATLGQAKTNRHRIVFAKDGGDQSVAAAVEAIDRQTREEQAAPPDIARTFAYWLTALCVGAARHRRGEVLSAHQYLFSYAINDLLALIAALAPAEGRGEGRDGFDQRRRFEQAYPALAAEIAGLLRQDGPRAAAGMLALGERLFATHPDYPAAAALAVRGYLGALEDSAPAANRQ